jgi:hypothetical protein
MNRIVSSFSCWSPFRFRPRRPSEAIADATASPREAVPANPAIDMDAYLRVSAEAARYGEPPSHRR